jgi:hypothetical protein
MYAAQSRSALGRLTFYLRLTHGRDPDAVTMAARATFTDPATVLASLDKLGKAELAALLSESSGKEGYETIERNLEARICSNDRRTVEALAHFAKLREQHGDYLRLLARIVALVGAGPLQEELRKRWAKELNASELRHGPHPTIDFSSVVVHAIERQLADRRATP